MAKISDSTFPPRLQSQNTCWPCDLCDDVEIASPRFDGDIEIPGMEPVCNSRCHAERFSDGGAP
jgi:hypothetical protein